MTVFNNTPLALYKLYAVSMHPVNQLSANFSVDVVPRGEYCSGQFFDIIELSSAGIYILNHDSLHVFDGVQVRTKRWPGQYSNLVASEPIQSRLGNMYWGVVLLENPSRTTDICANG